MANNTYVALDKVTLATAAASATFSSISSAYTDLIIVANLLSTTSARVKVRVGEGTIDTSSNYAYTVLFGNGTSAGSGGEQSVSELNYYWNAIPSGWSNYIFNFQNYSNTTTNKTVIGRGNSTAVETFANVGVWRATNAINIIEIRSGTGTFDAGSTFSLYGIRAEGVSPTVKAIGGAVYSDDTYYYHVFGASGTFTPTQSITADYLVVAGGGGGGATNFGGYGVGAGGGAGGVKAATVQSLSASAYTVTVGSGGAGGSGSTSGGTGTSSSISGSGITTLTATGGVGPGQTYSGGASGADPSNAGGSGGTTSSSSSETYAAGGGGGSGSVGGSWNSVRISGNGGNGTSSYSSWVIATGVGQVVSGIGYIAGGGGGGYGRRSSSAGAGSSGTGGLGGGGNGTNANNATGALGLNNTGSGGGGAGTINAGSPTSGKGGSGVVIVRYAK